MILRARIVVPVDRAPIENGVVVLQGDQCLASGVWKDWRQHLTGAVTDLGEVAVLPGLVNAHCHLDYTHMAGCLPPARSFTQWITGILALKAQWSYSEYAASWIAGARMLLGTGTTTVADIEAVPELLPEVWNATPLRVLSFLELTSVRQARAADRVLADALALADRLEHPRCAARLSPHAPYSTSPALLQAAAGAARRRGWRLVTHVAESDEEFAMYANAQGPMHEWLRRNGRDMSDCGGGSPVAHLDHLGYLSDHLLAVHLNCVSAVDAARLGRHGVHAVHCPRSHAYFQHRRFPLETLESAGVNVALGTDSLATVRCYRGRPVELDLFAEMRAFAACRPEVPPAGILRMATLNGGRALGFGECLGRLGAGACADLIAVPVSGAPSLAEEEILHHRGPVFASMIGGCWAIPPRQ